MSNPKRSLRTRYALEERRRVLALIISHACMMEIDGDEKRFTRRTLNELHRQIRQGLHR